MGTTPSWDSVPDASVGSSDTGETQWLLVPLAPTVRAQQHDTNKHPRLQGPRAPGGGARAFWRSPVPPLEQQVLCPRLEQLASS